MRLGKSAFQPAKFVQPAESKPQIPLIRPGLTVGAVTPIFGDPSSLLGGKFVFNPLGLAAKAAMTDWSKIDLGNRGITVTSAQTPVTSPSIANAAAKPADADPLAAFFVAPLKGAGTSWGIANGAQHISHASLVGYLTDVGVPSPNADWLAAETVKLAHSHGFHSVAIGVAAGGLVVAGVNRLKPGLSTAQKYGLWIVVAAVFGGPIYFLTRTQSPAIGEWTLDTMSSRYSTIDVPRGEAVKISSDNAGLVVATDEMLTDGKLRHAQYHIYPDGKDHPASQDFSSVGADSIRTYAKGNLITTDFLKKGTVLATEEREVSADQKQMTVTLTRRTSSKALKDVLVYARK